MSSLAGNISARRLARHGGTSSLSELLAAFPGAVDGESNVDKLRAVKAQLCGLIDRKIEQLEASATAATRGRPHITLSTKFAGEALEISKNAKAKFESFGFTVYNPNTDCGLKEGDAVKGQSNWLRSFRENGLKRSFRTRGFVVQLQADQKREPSDMQVAEEDMATETAKEGVPIIGIYATPVDDDVAKALLIAHRQWSSGRCQPLAVPAEDVVLGDESLTVLAAHLSAMGAMAHLKGLNLEDNAIGDAGVEALSKACADGALANLQELSLKRNQIGDVGITAIANACTKGAVVKLSYLGLDGNPASDAAQQKAQYVIRNHNM